MNRASEPEITHSATPSTGSSPSAGNTSLDDLPNVVVSQSQGTDAAGILDVAIIANDDLDRLTKATFKSGGTAPGDVAPSSEPVSVDTDRSAAAEADSRALLMDIRDGVLTLTEEDTAPSGFLFTPRGPLTKPSDVKRPRKNPRDSESKEGKTGDKTKDSKNKPDSGQKEKKKTGCIIM